MNLFELFRDAALDHLEEVSGSRLVSADLMDQLHHEHGVLSAAYDDAKEIKYDTLERRLAYTMFYAPKHAYLWKTYANCNWDPRKILRLNSLGTGPGSELVGLAEAFRTRGLGAVEAVCLEREDAWRFIAHRVFRRYEALGVRFSVLWVVDSSNFRRNQHVVGSFVLSELARQGALDLLRSQMTGSVGPALATFIDGAAVKTNTGKHLLSNLAGQDRWDHFESRGWLSKDEINTAWNECDPKYCGHILPSEPNVCALRYNFR